MDSYDVAVIGAGPAGVMAAWTAAKQGAHTVLLERETSAGRKPCAEGVLSEALDDAQMSPQGEFAPNRNYPVIAEFQYDMIDCRLDDESKLEIFIGHKKAPAGYIWIFPKGKGTANVGIGLKGSGAKSLLDRFIQEHPGVFGNAKIERSQAAPVPVGGEIEDYVTDNMMLCGDAAGQVIHLTGAGIHTSIVSAKLAGEVAGKAAREGDVGSKRLSAYKERFEALWGEKISNSLRALESFERFSDEELNIIADFLQVQDLADMAHEYD